MPSLQEQIDLLDTLVNDAELIGAWASDPRTRTRNCCLADDLRVEIRKLRDPVAAVLAASLRLDPSATAPAAAAL
jgi:hypothetical protein